MTGNDTATTSLTAETIRHDERRRIARDLHDELGSQLTAIKMALAQLTRRLPPETDLLSQASHTDTLIDDAIAAMHMIIDDLHPPVLDLGLASALEHLNQSFGRQTRLACSFSALPADANPAPLPAIHLYRIAQEALNNVARHSQASQSHMHLLLTDNHLELHISDNGCGISAPDLQQAQTSGIRGMRQRAQQLGGSLHIGSSDLGGTLISVWIPVVPHGNTIE